MSIKNNTTNLQNLLEQVNDLPEAGGLGVEIETYTGTINGPYGLGDLPDLIFIYTDETLTRRELILSQGEEATITVAANTVVVQYNEYSNPDWKEYDGSLFASDTFGSVFIPIENGFEI